MLSYEQLVREIKQRRGTQVPALFIEVAEHTIRMGCFVPNSVERIVRNIEQKYLKKEKSKKDEIRDITLHCGSCLNKFILPENNIHKRCGLNGCKGILHKI